MATLKKKTLNEIMHDYNRGAFTANNAAFWLLSIVSEENVEEVLGELPPELITRISRFVHSKAWAMHAPMPTARQVEIAQSWLSKRRSGG